MIKGCNLTTARRRGAAFMALTVLGFGAVQAADLPQADHIYTNGTVYTVEADQPWAEAVAIKGDEIVFVGSSVEAAKYAGPRTETHDLKQGFMMPGFIDTHAHPIMGGAYARALSLDTFARPEDWVKAIGEYAGANPDLPLIFGYGFLASAFGEAGPTSEMLDTVVSDRPVFIMDEGFHSGWGNSKALESLGITRDTADPTPGFNYYKRDSAGNPTGWFLEGTASLAMEHLNVFNEASIADGTDLVFDIMNGYGITAVFDAGALDVATMALGVLQRLDAAGEFTVRLVGSHMVAAPDQMDGALDLVENLAATTKSDRYHIRMLKIMDDGTIEGRTAGMFVDYQGDPGNKGATVFTQAQLDSMVIDAAGRQIDVHIHALGERAIHEALNAIEAARTAHSDSTSRYTICHIQVMTDAAVKRFAELDVIAQSTPLWTSYDTEGRKFVNADQFSRYFRYSSLKKAGVRLTFGSDFPASGAGTLGMSPLFNMEVGLTRQQAGQPDAPVQPSVEERLDMESLIRGYTADAAYQLHMEDEIGSLKVGKKADMIILDHNPFATQNYEIHKIQVKMTMMGGRVVYQK
ncbi:amidohydrolase [Paremcibacter congregatus]|uniref:amidohydrolase n=1 Tax=Paremcibacter congregatus TaxID=2043170 RepID=UPI0030EC7B1F